MELENTPPIEEKNIVNHTLEAIYGDDGLTPGGINDAISLLESIAIKYGTRDLHGLVTIGSGITIDDRADRLAILFVFNYLKRAGNFGIRVEGWTLSSGYTTTEFDSKHHIQIFGDEPNKKWLDNGERVIFQSPTIIRGKDNTIISKGLVKRA